MNQNQKKLSKFSFLFFLLTIFLSFSAISQRNSLEDMKLIAHHLPTFVKSADGTIDVLVGDKITYQKESTISSIKKIEEWMVEYPKEVAVFKKVANTFFKQSAEELTISKEQTTLYNDYKSVWLFVTQFDVDIKYETNSENQKNHLYNNKIKN